MKKLFFIGFVSLVLFIAGCQQTPASLDDALNSIELPETVDSNITWPTLEDQYNGITVSYASSNTAVITDGGVVERQLEDVVVEITITVLQDGVTRDKRVDVTVLALSQVELLAEFLSRISLPLNVDEDVDFDAFLPTHAKYGHIEVAFTSSDEGIMTDTGNIVQASHEQFVIITVTAILGELSDDKDVTITVAARELTDQEMVDAAQETFELPYATVDSSIMLPATYENTTLTYVSSHEEYLDADGTVTRPYIDDVDVTLTVTFTKGEATATKAFVIKVLGLPLEDIPVILEATYTLTEELLETELNAVLTYSGTVSYIEATVLTVELEIYYGDDAVLETFTTETDAHGTFEFVVSVNDYDIGWDWYKFRLNVIEGENRKDGVLVPFDQAVLSAHGVLKGDGDLRRFETVSNSGYLNILMHGADAEDTTDIMRVIADYERLNLSRLHFVDSYQLPESTGQWGQDSFITWSAEENDYFTIVDNSLVVDETSPSGISLAITATITYGEESRDKTYQITVEKATVTFINQEASWLSSADSETLGVNVTGDVINENNLDATVEMELYIEVEGDLIILETFENIGDLTNYEFHVLFHDIDFQGEWAKLRIKITVDEDISYYTYVDGSITTPDLYGRLVEEAQSATYFELGNIWDMLYIEPGKALSPSDASTDNTKLIVEDNRVILEISGTFWVDGITTSLTIAGLLEPVDNLSEEPGQYLFRVDITDFLDNDDWLDVHVHYEDYVQDVLVSSGYGDIYAPYDIKDQLNDTYEVQVGDKVYYFAEWESNLKIVVKPA